MRLVATGPFGGHAAIPFVDFKISRTSTIIDCVQGQVALRRNLVF